MRKSTIAFFAGFVLIWMLDAHNGVYVAAGTAFMTMAILWAAYRVYKGVLDFIFGSPE